MSIFLENARFAFGITGSNHYRFSNSLEGDLLYQAVKEIEKAKQIEELLKRLLALVHKDGGHYTQYHGIIKSADDAIASFHNLL